MSLQPVLAGPLPTPSPASPLPTPIPASPLPTPSRARPLPRCHRYHCRCRELRRPQPAARPDDVAPTPCRSLLLCCGEAVLDALWQFVSGKSRSAVACANWSLYRYHQDRKCYLPGHFRCNLSPCTPDGREVEDEHYWDVDDWSKPFDFVAFDAECNSPLPRAPSWSSTESASSGSHEFMQAGGRDN